MIFSPGSVTSVSLDGQIVPFGRTANGTSWSYDSFGRKTLETRADGTKTQWAYLYCTGINGGKVNLINRMKAWVNGYYPGTKIGVTESAPWCA